MGYWDFHTTPKFSQTSFILSSFLCINLLLRACVCTLKNLKGSGTLNKLRSSSAIWRRQWQPSPVFLRGKSHGWRSLVGSSRWGRYESDTTEQLHFHFSLSCIGEGNGNPHQYSCLENPRDGGAWWAAVYGVTQRRTPTEAM